MLCCAVPCACVLSGPGSLVVSVYWLEAGGYRMKLERGTGSMDGASAAIATVLLTCTLFVGFLSAGC